jgi:secreted PhoX family phosphatase
MEPRRAAVGAPLRPVDANGLMLPPGFTSRVVARSGVDVAGYLWHSAPAGGACFPDGTGWLYVANSDVPMVGGASAVRFGANGAVLDAYPTLSGTDMNAGGGATPWHTWLSCEGSDRGQVWETDPWDADEPAARAAMGVFRHRACAVDADHGVVYLTEAQPDGGFYRFTPALWPNLATGVLDVLTDHGWARVPDPHALARPTRWQVAGTTPFDCGADCFYAAGVCWFATNGDGRVWAYDTAADTLSERDTAPADPLTRTVGGVHEVCLVLPDHGVAPFVRLVGHERSRIAGAALSPDGTRLYFSSPHGATGSPAAGVTYEVSSPDLR